MGGVRAGREAHLGICRAMPGGRRRCAQVRLRVHAGMYRVDRGIQVCIGCMGDALGVFMGSNGRALQDAAMSVDEEWHARLDVANEEAHICVEKRRNADQSIVEAVKHQHVTVNNELMFACSTCDFNVQKSEARISKRELTTPYDQPVRTHVEVRSPRVSMSRSGPLETSCMTGSALPCMPASGIRRMLSSTQSPGLGYLAEGGAAL